MTQKQMGRHLKRLTHETNYRARMSHGISILKRILGNEFRLGFCVRCQLALIDQDTCQHSISPE